MMRCLCFLFFVAWSCLFLTATAQTKKLPDPASLLRNTVVTLQNEVSHNRASLAKSPKQLFALVKKVILPMVDVQRMAGITLGSKWRQATKTQREQFIDQFGLMLTKTYSKALLTVSKYSVTIFPMRGKGWQQQKYVAVNGVVKPEGGGSPSRVTYYLVRSGDSWKVYDFAVEGVSFVQNFQKQFSEYTSLPPLIKKIEQVNQRSNKAS